jgi:ubiquitin-activating enzyme E1
MYACAANVGLQFFLREEDVGKSRADVTVPRLAELNAYVPVRNLGGQPGHPITVDLIKGFQVRTQTHICGLAHLCSCMVQAVVLCGVPLSKQLEINQWTHENDVYFVAAETRGLFG